MTTRAGAYVAGVVDRFYSAAEGTRRADPGAVLVNALTIGSSPPKYKNQGWYAAGSAWESWISTPLPSNFPPSGHTLTEVTYVLLQD